MPDTPWIELTRANPELAATGVRLLYQGGDTAAAFLATVATDTGPRVHPVYPVLAGDDLWLFIVNLSPKYRDLLSNPRCALHSLPTPDGGEEFYVRGRAFETPDDQLRSNVIAATGGRQGSHDFEALFRVSIDSVLYTRWEGWNTADAWPAYTHWRPTQQNAG